jgi:hypothetical protein
VAAEASINGQVLGGGAPIANPAVTLFAASAGAPKQLAQAKTGADGLSTRCGGHGGVIFFGMARPVLSPQIGPARPFWQGRALGACAPI